MSLAGSSTPISCFGGNDGTASVAVSGGSPPFIYSWNTVPVQTNSSITNLLPGTYNVTVTDFYGCTASTSVVAVSYTHLDVYKRQAISLITPAIEEI